MFTAIWSKAGIPNNATDLRKMAEGGDAECQYYLGCFMQDGRNGVEKNRIEAIKWIRKAAEGDYSYAQLRLGTSYCYGSDADKDPVEGLKWLRKASEHGDSHAAYEIGQCYYYGNGVPKDMVEAVKWFQKGTAGGSPRAREALEKCEREGVAPKGMADAVNRPSKQEFKPTEKSASIGMTGNSSSGGAGSSSVPTKTSNYWDTFAQWEALMEGKDGMPKDRAKADQLLPLLITDVYLVRFRPADGFNPRTPGEFLEAFHEASQLRSERSRLGGTGFFRTRVENDKLIASFFTQQPERMKQDIERDSRFIFISNEKVTAETFVRHVESRQESLGKERVPTGPNPLEKWIER
ncbi:MAG: tetratricopeptide repeat protein [Terrimicrobiaceae bacterium]